MPAARLPAVRAGRWRELTRWPGSYLVIARNGATLAVLGDLAGQHPVYWRTHGGTLWWATSALALAALGGAPVDPTALAAHLALAQPDVLGQRSLLRCVNRGPGGHLLLADPSGAHAVRFEPAEYGRVDLPVAAATVRAALGEAVATRLELCLRGPAAAAPDPGDRFLRARGWGRVPGGRSGRTAGRVDALRSTIAS
jgi:asparagine synthase (glutamine-hydrolysing)